MGAAIAGPGPQPAAAAARGIPVLALQNGILWLLVFCGCIVFIEPSPFEIVFVLAAVAFLATGLKLPRESLPFLSLMTAFNVGGAVSLVEFTHDPKAITFVAISFYLLFVTMFFVMLMLDHTEVRLRAIQRAQIVAASAAAVAGILGYFNVAGLSAVFTQFGGTRASGPFKDPNVFGPFLTVAATFLFHGVVCGRVRRLWLRLLTLCLLSFAVLVSFSRGAWGVYALSVTLVVILNLLTSRSWAQRRRIAIVAAVGLAGVAAAGLGALSVPTIGKMVEERSVLLQSYDQGETGRFGKQRRSIPMLLDLPNGFGPLQFDKRFGENPHNVYIFAFSSYGWLGGVAYLAIILVTCVVGWRLVFLRTRVQSDAIAVWCCLFPQILQGFQIDTDHWRHFWMLIGILWGLAIVASRERVGRTVATAAA